MLHANVLPGPHLKHLGQVPVEEGDHGFNARRPACHKTSAQRCSSQPDAHRVQACSAVRCCRVTFLLRVQHCLMMNQSQQVVSGWSTCHPCHATHKPLLEALQQLLVEAHALRVYRGASKAAGDNPVPAERQPAGRMTQATLLHTRISSGCAGRAGPAASASVNEAGRA